MEATAKGVSPRSGGVYAAMTEQYGFFILPLQIDGIQGIIEIEKTGGDVIGYEGYSE